MRRLTSSLILCALMPALVLSAPGTAVAGHDGSPDRDDVPSLVAAVAEANQRMADVGSDIQIKQEGVNRALVEIDIEYVTSEAIICMQNLLRKYPAVSDRIIQGIGVFLRSVDDAEAKKALLWMLSEYGHVIPEAPYLLEPPAVINISRGRQLFVDSFLIDGHAAYN